MAERCLLSTPKTKVTPDASSDSKKKKTCESFSIIASANYKTSKSLNWYIAPSTRHHTRCCYIVVGGHKRRWGVLMTRVLDGAANGRTKSLYSDLLSLSFPVSPVVISLESFFGCNTNMLPYDVVVVETAHNKPSVNREYQYILVFQLIYISLHKKQTNKSVIFTVK